MNEHGFPCSYCDLRYERDVHDADAMRTRTGVGQTKQDGANGGASTWRERLRTGYVMARRVRLCVFVTLLKRCVTMVGLRSKAW